MPKEEKEKRPAEGGQITRSNPKESKRARQDGDPDKADPSASSATEVNRNPHAEPVINPAESSETDPRWKALRIATDARDKKATAHEPPTPPENPHAAKRARSKSPTPQATSPTAEEAGEAGPAHQPLNPEAFWDPTPEQRAILDSKELNTPKSTTEELGEILTKLAHKNATEESLNQLVDSFTTSFNNESEYFKSYLNQEYDLKLRILFLKKASEEVKYRQEAMQEKLKCLISQTERVENPIMQQSGVVKAIKQRLEGIARNNNNYEHEFNQSIATGDLEKIHIDTLKLLLLRLLNNKLITLMNAGKDPQSRLYKLKEISTTIDVHIEHTKKLKELMESSSIPDLNYHYQLHKTLVEQELLHFQSIFSPDNYFSYKAPSTPAHMPAGEAGPAAAYPATPKQSHLLSLGEAGPAAPYPATPTQIDLLSLREVKKLLINLYKSQAELHFESIKALGTAPDTHPHKEKLRKILNFANCQLGTTSNTITKEVQQASSILSDIGRMKHRMIQADPSYQNQVDEEGDLQKFRADQVGMIKTLDTIHEKLKSITGDPPLCFLQEDSESDLKAHAKETIIKVSTLLSEFTKKILEKYLNSNISETELLRSLKSIHSSTSSLITTAKNHLFEKDHEAFSELCSYYLTFNRSGRQVFKDQSKSPLNKESLRRFKTFHTNIGNIAAKILDLGSIDIAGDNHGIAKTIIEVRKKFIEEEGEKKQEASSGYAGAGASAADPSPAAAAIATVTTVVASRSKEKDKGKGKQKASTSSQQGAAAAMVPESTAPNQGNATLGQQVRALTEELKELRKEVLDLKTQVAKLEKDKTPKEPGRSPSPTADLRVQQQGGPGHAQQPL